MNLFFYLLPVLLPVLSGILFFKSRRPDALSFGAALATGLSIFGLTLCKEPVGVRFSGTLEFLLDADGFSLFFLAQKPQAISARLAPNTEKPR